MLKTVDKKLAIAITRALTIVGVVGLIVVITIIRIMIIIITIIISSSSITINAA